MSLKFTRNFLFSFFLLSSSAFSSDTRVTDENVPFLYESRSDIKAPDDKLAEFISSDYRNARDEFTKHDLMEQIKPVIQKKLQEGSKTKEISLVIGGSLGNYDFDNNSFPTGFGDSSFIPFKNGYAVIFTNGDQIKTLPVSVDHARTLSGALRMGRRASFSVFGEIVGVKEKRMNWNTNKTIEVKITKLEVKLNSGTFVGTKLLK